MTGNNRFAGKVASILGLLTCVLYLWSGAAVGAGDKFRILKGGTLEVCQAYVSALEQIAFDSGGPGCGRPIGEAAPETQAACAGYRVLKPRFCKAQQTVAPVHALHFAEIRRAYLSIEEMFELYEQMASLERFGNPDHWKRQGTTLLYPEREQALESIRAKAYRNMLAMWRYDPPLDLDNDGIPDPIVMWSRSDCFEYRSTGTAGIAVDEQYKHVDVKRTVGLFSEVTWPLPDFEADFPFLEGSLGIFRYRGKTYLDAWLPDASAPERAAREDLRVYLQEAQVRRELCRVKMTKQTKRRGD